MTERPGTPKPSTEAALSDERLAFAELLLFLRERGRARRLAREKEEQACGDALALPEGESIVNERAG